MTATDSASTSDSVERTEEIAREFAGQLRPGDVILMTGEVGSGKSTFVRAALRALGATGAIPSPTFTLARRYEGESGPLSHLDLYRIGPLAEEVPDLLGEYLTPDGIAFVEWPGGSESELRTHARRIGQVHLEMVDTDRRQVGVSYPA